MSDLDVFLKTVVVYTNLEETATRQQESNAIEAVTEQISTVTAAVLRDLLNKIAAELVHPGVDGCVKDLQKAKKLKEIGNKEFAAGWHGVAAREYSNALRFLDPGLPSHSSLSCILLCNRALALSKQRNHTGALADSTAAIACGGPSVKALFRKAHALHALGWDTAAKEDAQHALRLLEEGGGSTTHVRDLLLEIEANSSTVEKGKGAKKAASTEEDGPKWHSVPWQLHQDGDSEGEGEGGASDSVANDDRAASLKRQLEVTKCSIEELNSLAKEAGLKSIGITMDDHAGRQLVAEEDIAAGTDVYQDEPVVHALMKEARLEHCANCCRRLPEGPFWSCTGCALAVFCSSECRESEVFHVAGGPECGTPWTALLPAEVVLALRLARHLHNGSQNANSLQARAVASLPDHFSDMEAEEAAHYAAVAVVAHAAWTRAVHQATCKPPSRNGGSGGGGGGSNNGISLTQADVLRALCLVRMNGLAIVPKVYAAKEGAIALGMFPVAGYMNHSCIPNVSLRFEGKKMIARAPTAVPVGSPLLHCYGPQVGEMTTQQRRAMLKQQYCFICTCPSCSSPVEDSEQEMVGLKCTSSGCEGALPLPSSSTAGLASKYDLMEQQQQQESTCTACGASLAASVWEASVQPRLETALKKYNDGQDGFLALLRQSMGQQGPQAFDAEVDTFKCVELLKESLLIREKLLHANNQVLGATHDTLAWGCEEAGDISGWLQHMQASFKIAERSFPQGSTNIAFLQWKIAAMMESVLFGGGGGAGDRKEAQRLRTAALETLNLHYGPEVEAELATDQRGDC